MPVHVSNRVIVSFKALDAGDAARARWEDGWFLWDLYRFKALDAGDAAAAVGDLPSSLHN